jgi:hypothetical protein
MTSELHPVVAAATALSQVLMFENEALAALTFAESTIVAMEKEQVIAHFTKAVDQHGTAELSPVLARQLSTLVVENKRLLERALHVQGQVIACIARAAPKRCGNHRAYGRTGGWADDSGAVPVAFAARA